LFKSNNEISKMKEISNHLIKEWKGLVTHINEYICIWRIEINIMINDQNKIPLIPTDFKCELFSNFHFENNNKIKFPNFIHLNCDFEMSLRSIQNNEFENIFLINFAKNFSILIKENKEAILLSQEIKKKVSLYNLDKLKLMLSNSEFV